MTADVGELGDRAVDPDVVAVEEVAEEGVGVEPVDETGPGEAQGDIGIGLGAIDQMLAPVRIEADGQFGVSERGGGNFEGNVDGTGCDLVQPRAAYVGNAQRAGLMVLSDDDHGVVDDLCGGETPKQVASIAVDGTDQGQVGSRYDSSGNPADELICAEELLVDHGGVLWSDGSVLHCEGGVVGHV